MVVFVVFLVVYDILAVLFLKEGTCIVMLVGEADIVKGEVADMA